MTSIDASTASSSSTSQIRRRKSISSSYLTLCVILALSFISLLVSLLSFNGIRTTLTILNRGVTATTGSNTTSEHLTNNDNNVFVAAGRNNESQQSAVNSTSSSKNNSATNDDDGMIEINTIEYDNELRRMVDERKKDGAQRGKIAWLMRYVRFLQQS